MGFLDNSRDNNGQPAGEGHTDMNQQQTLANAVSQARADTNNPGLGGQSGASMADDEGLPSVNRRKGSNKLVTILGFIFILGAAAAMVVAVNGNKGPKEKKDHQSETIANNLPPLAIPPAPVSVTATPVPLTPVAAGPQGATTLKPIAVQANQPGMTAGGRKLPPEWYERKMAGTVMVDTKKATSGTPSLPASLPAAGAQLVADSNGAVQQAGGGGGGSRSELGARLEPTVTKGVSASLLPDRNFLITKGTTLDCALETALNSTLPGITTCRLTRDVYSDNNQVLLLDRGSQLVGEYQGGMKQGQARLFVLWTRAKTPNGVVVSLNSPGTDALGRSGFEGWVDTHFAERFGAAILFTFIQDSLKAIIARQAEHSAVIIGNTVNSGEKVVEKILESTVNIPPTLIKNQGDHIQVMVARDLDFASVYGLQVKQ
jgi:type IV secretion system protein VirB10